MKTKLPFLNAVLAFDAATCALMGAGLALAGPVLAAPLGLPGPFLSAIGAFLIGFALLLGWAASRSAVPAALATLIVAGNLAWSAASLALVAEGLFALTSLGKAFVLLQAGAVLAIALAEYAGLRRAKAVAG